MIKMRSLRAPLLFFACQIIFTTEGYRILGIFPFCSRSHQMLFDTISRGLAKRGHQVDIVTCFPPKEKLENFTVLMNTAVNLGLSIIGLTKKHCRDRDVLLSIAEWSGNELCKLMGRDELQRVIKNPPKDPPYDVVIMEAFGANCFLGLGEIFKVPVIFASTTAEMPWVNRAIGNPPNLAFFPSFFETFVHPLTFWERVKNTFHEASVTYKCNSITGDVQTNLMRN